MLAKYIRFDDAQYQYLTRCRSNRQDPLLDELQKETQALGEASRMLISDEQTNFLIILTAALGVRSALEVGTFTGGSSICIARSLPADGRLLCLDISKEWTDIARKYWQKAGVAGKIELRVGPAAESLRKLEPGWQFDFAFIDADKSGYDTYYELVLPRLKQNGVILFDNMLWSGKLSGEIPPEDKDGRAIDALNRKLADDPRVESVLLPIADGIHLVRKK